MPEFGDKHLFEVTGSSQELRVLRFEGTEGMSELFRFEILLASDDPSIAFEDVVAKDAKLSMLGGEPDETRLVHGIVARFEFIDATSSEDSKVAVYRVTLVPRVHRLQHRRDNRIFQEKTSPEIIKAVLEGAGLASGDDFRLALTATYPTNEYSVQYRESDWDFVCRLMEEAGIGYFFEQKDDKHVLVLVDHKEAHSPIAGTSDLVYRPARGAIGATIGAHDHVSRFDYAEEIRPGKTTVRDFNFKKPSLLLESKGTASTETDLEIYDQPGEFGAKADGDVIAKIRLDAERLPKKSGGGTSGCARLLPGATFKLTEHMRDAFNQEYLVVRVMHRGFEPQRASEVEEGIYSNTFEVIPSVVVYRPPALTPRPMVRGVQTAIVVGPSGEEIHTDEHGRVKVQFHWDRLGKKDDKSSCWIRVSQMWAGEGWGSMFIPRIGHEVVVSFEEGNPDKPLIVGSVYHGTNVPPYSLPANKTRSTIKSNTSAGGEGFNEIRFEDKKGSEEVFFHAQKDHNLVVENDENKQVKHDQTLTVTNDRTKKIDHDQIATIGNDDTITVKHDRTETIENDETVTVKHDRTTSVEHDLTQSVGNDETLDVGGARSLSVSGDQTTEISGDHAHTVSGKQTINVTKAVTQKYDDALSFTLAKDRAEKIDGGTKLEIAKDDETKIGGKHKLEITGDSEEKVSGKKKMTFEQELTIEVGQAKITLKADGTIKLEGVQLEVKGSAAVKIQGAQLELKSDAAAKIEAGAKMDVKAAMLDLNGSGMVKMGGGMVGVG
jgi:type VI secretion system secreted protein VgrG